MDRSDAHACIRGAKRRAKFWGGCGILLRVLGYGYAWITGGGGGGGGGFSTFVANNNALHGAAPLSCVFA